MTPVRGAFFRFLLAGLFLLAGALWGAPQPVMAAAGDCPGHHDQNDIPGKSHPAGAVCCAAPVCAALPASVADIPLRPPPAARRPSPPVSDRLSAGLTPTPALRPPAFSA